MNFDFAALERRVAALEHAQTASLRFGRVTSVSGGKARVEFADGQQMNSYDLSTVQSRVLKDQDIKMPDTGEPVVCLFSGQGWEQGVVLGAYYNGQEGDPGQPPHMDYHHYEDGTELYYDRQNHKLVAKVMGDCEIECEKAITAKAKQDALVESETKLTLKAPQVEIRGLLTMANVDGGPTRGILRGDYIVLEGGISVPDKDVTAGSVALRQHCHENSGGQGVGGKPVGG